MVKVGYLVGGKFVTTQVTHSNYEQIMKIFTTPVDIHSSEYKEYVSKITRIVKKSVCSGMIGVKGKRNAPKRPCYHPVYLNGMCKMHYYRSR